MKIRTGLLAIATAYCATMGSAHAFGLMDAFMAARQYDPQYRAAWQTREAGLQEERIARAQLLPQASMSYTYNRNWLNQNIHSPQTGQTQVNSNDNYPSYVGRIEVRQPVVNFQGWAGLRQGQALSRQAEVEFDGRHQQLMLRLYETYANALLARDQLSIAQSQAVALEEQMRSNDLMFKSGEGTRTDMIETRSRYDVARAQVIAAEDELGAAVRALVAITGPGQLTSVDQLDQLVPKFSPSPAQLESVDQWLALARTSNAQVAAGRFGVQAADASVDRSRAGHYPQVNLVAAHQRDEADSVSTINQRNRNSMIGVQVSVPIFSGGGTTAQTSQAVANYERAQAELDATRSGVEVELLRQYALVKSNAEKIKALESAVESASLLVEATQRSVAGGMRVNLDVLNAEERLYTSRRDLAQARYDYLNAYMQLRYYAGVLTVDDLETVSRYFAPPGTYSRDSAYSSNEADKIDMRAASRKPTASVGNLPTGLGNRSGLR